MAEQRSDNSSSFKISFAAAEPSVNFLSQLCDLPPGTEQQESIPPLKISAFLE